MTEVEIEYCAPCNFRGQALEIQEAVLDAVEDKLERLVLAPEHGGVIIVRVDGEQVFHSGEDDYDTETLAADIADSIAARIDAA